MAEQEKAPSRSGLNTRIAPATSVRVLSFDDQGEKRVCTVDDPALVAELVALLAVDPDPDSGSYCMCGGDPHLAFYEDDRPLARVGVHHGATLRWDRWESDADLLHGSELAEWLADQGAPGLLDEIRGFDRTGD